MEILIRVLCFIIFPTVAFSQDGRFGATAGTMASTFSIQGDKLTGTCFLVTKDGTQYFVTAAHLFKESHKSGDLIPIMMFIQNQWQPFDAKIYFHPNRNVDIAM